MSLTKREVVNHLRRYRYDPEHRWGKQGRTVRAVATLANTTPFLIKDLRDHEVSNGPNWLARVARAVEMIEAGEVRLVGTNTPHARVEWVAKPARRPRPLARMHWAADHVEWVPCRTCWGDKWTPVVLNGRAHYACKNCVGPLHWPTMGARAPDAIEIVEMFKSAMREGVS
jgi:hypothetical protein